MKSESEVTSSVGHPHCGCLDFASASIYFDRWLRRISLSALVLCVIALPLTVDAQEADPLKQVSGGVGSFIYYQRSDPMTDANTSRIITIDFDKRLSVMWACLEDGLNVLFMLPNGYSPSTDGTASVTYRLGRLRASGPSPWTLNTTHEFAFMPLEDVAAFTRAARSADYLVIRIRQERDGHETTYRVRLNKLADALRMLKSCR